MMRNQGQVYLGLVVIAVGILFLIGNVFKVDVGLFCWPTALILLGVWLLLRPSTLSPGTAFTQRLFGEIGRSGSWTVQPEEFFAFVADLDLDVTKADIPLGETKLRVVSFVGDVEILTPEEVGVAVSSTAFVSEVKLSGHKEESFLVPLRVQTDNYKLAERKIQLEVVCFVGDVKVRRV